MHRCSCNQTFKTRKELFKHHRETPCLPHIKQLFKSVQHEPNVEDFLKKYDLARRVSNLEQEMSGNQIPEHHGEGLTSNFTHEGDQVGFIYLVRDREFIRCNEEVYKVGMTIQDVDVHGVKRLSSYKKGSELVFLWQCIDPTQTLSVETAIKQRFNERFKRHRDGFEYFIGDRFTMVDTIMTIIKDFNVQSRRQISGENKEESRKVYDLLYVLKAIPADKRHILGENQFKDSLKDPEERP